MHPLWLVIIGWLIGSFFGLQKVLALGKKAGL